MSYSSVVLGEPSLQSYWRLGEAAGSGSVADSQAAISGTPTNVTLGAPGGLLTDNDTAASFNGDIGGTNGSHIDFGNNYGFAGTPAFSFEALINPAAIDASNRRIVDKSEPTNRGWYVTVVSGQITFSRGDSAAEDLKASTTILTASRWYLLSVTYDGSAMRMYLNGTEEGTAISSTRSLVANTNPFRVGQRASDLIRTWNGVIDEVSIYNAALTADQVVTHYQAALTTVQGQPDFARNAFPFMVGPARAPSRSPSSIIAMEVAGPGPYGGFDRFLFPRLHPEFALALTPVSLTLDFPIEALQAIAQTAIDPVNAAQDLATSSSLPVEAIQQMTPQTAQLVLEALGGIATTGQDPVEALGGVAQTGVLVLDALGGIVRALTDPLEATSGLSPTTSDPIEALQGLAATGLFPLEDLAGIAQAGALFIEALQAILQTRSDPLEASQGLATTSSDPVEAVGGIAATGVMPFTAAGGIAATGVFPIDASGQLAVSQSAVLVIEALQGVATVPLLPLDEAQQVTVTSVMSVESVKQVGAQLVQTIIEAAGGMAAVSVLPVAMPGGLVALAVMPLDMISAAQTPALIVITDQQTAQAAISMTDTRADIAVGPQPVTVTIGDNASTIELAQTAAAVSLADKTP